MGKKFPTYVPEKKPQSESKLIRSEFETTEVLIKCWQHSVFSIKYFYWGIVHECNTSVAVIIIRMKVFIGIAARLSTSNSRKLLFSISSWGII